MRWAARSGLVFCLAVGPLLAVPPAGAVAGYGDVADHRYYARAVQWQVDNGITGIDDACFSPDAPVSRGESAVYLWNMEGRPAAVPHSFTDVAFESQNGPVSWMAEAGITTGTQETKFSPEASLTRAEIATFLYRLADKEAAVPHSFTDVTTPWQQAPISWMAETGITTGTSRTTFSPDATVTRAQLITFLYRYQGEPAVTVDPATPACCGFRVITVNSDSCASGLTSELSRLVETAQNWDPSAQVAISVLFSNGSAYGVAADEPVRSASAVKPLWAAAAIDVAGLEAVTPLSHRALVLSDNHAAGEMIDLADGIDAVNTWTWDTAGLDGTHLSGWSFGRRRVSGFGLGPTRTTMRDLALFYARLHQGQLLGRNETARLKSWLRSTPRRLSYVDGVLLDRLPLSVATSALHKTGWLPPGCCAVDARLIVDAGLVALPNGKWFAMALSSSNGRQYDRSVKWLGLAACRIYAVVADDKEHICDRATDPAD